MPSKKKKPGKSLKKYASLFSKIAFDPPPKEPGMARSNESVAKYERDLADYVNKRDEKLKEERESLGDILKKGKTETEKQLKALQETCSKNQPPIVQKLVDQFLSRT